MSAENVEIVREILQAFAERDRVTATRPLDPQIEWDATRSPVDDMRGTYEGLDGVVDFWRRWLGAWKTIEIGEPELSDGGDQILGWFAGQRNVGRHSGIEVEMPEFGFLYTFRAGKIIRVTLYTDRAEALEAAGLPARG